MPAEAPISTHRSQVLPRNADATRVGPIQPTAGRPVRAVRFALLGTLVSVAIATATEWASHRAVFFLGALAASIGSVVARAAPRGRVSLVAALTALPALTLMQAHAGGIASGYSVLLIAVTLW